MEQGFLKVAAVTPKIKVADTAYNAGVLVTKIKEASQQGAKLIVFPELCITGYTCADLFLQELLLQKAADALEEILQQSKDMDALIFVGLPVERDGKIYNVAAALHHGTLLGMIPKKNIPAYAEFYEGRHFCAGMQEVSPFLFRGRSVPFGTNLLFTCEEVQGLSVGCEICEDIWVGDMPSIRHAAAGATVIVNLSASDETVGKDAYRELLVKSASARLFCGYVFSSCGEGESTSDLVFGGHTIIAENGSILKQAKHFGEEMTLADLDIQRIRMERRRVNTFAANSGKPYVKVPFSLQKEEVSLTRSFAPLPFVPSDVTVRRERCSEILSIQSYGLKKRYEHTGCKKAVLGISGGLDSTLALLVTVRTFDMLQISRKNIFAVTMPCFGTTDRTYDNACRLAALLGVTLEEIDIREAVSVHFRDIRQPQEKQDVTYENSQARERTQVLMDVANRENGLVIGTGDMSELALGWATYNGDHMSMYGVNSGVPKTLVRHLVKFYADTCSEKSFPVF